MTLTDIAAPWLALNAALGIAAPVADEAQYLRLQAFAEELAEQLPDDAGDPLWGLVSLIADRIREYENRVHPWPNLPPHELLRALMDEHGMSQKDLPEVGPQSVVSEILAGKRALNLRQVKAIARRFHVPMEALAG